MGEVMIPQKKEATKRGWIAVGGWGFTGWMVERWFTGGAFFLVLVGVVAAVFFTWRWFTWRAKWGMHF